MAGLGLGLGNIHGATSCIIDGWMDADSYHDFHILCTYLKKRKKWNVLQFALQAIFSLFLFSFHIVNMLKHLSTLFCSSEGLEVNSMNWMLFEWWYAVTAERCLCVGLTL